MQTAKRQRGRPKGTGINDRDTLMRIAEIVVANPALKPTTAIKQAGITNPSTIRRLRDKFADEGDRLIAEARSRQTASTAATPASAPVHPAVRPRINATVNPATKVSQRIASLASTLSGPALQPSQPRAQTTNAARRPTGAQAPQSRPALGLPNNIEALVIGMIGEALGVKGPALTSSPIIALIKEQAKMIDAILPILKQQLQSAERQMKKATVA